MGGGRPRGEYPDVLSGERELVAGCLAGEEPAFREFVERFQGLVFGVCLRMLGDRHEAEDVAQEVFLRAVRNLDRWDGERPLRPWLLTIAANRCRTRLGRRRRTPAWRPLPEDLPDPQGEAAPLAELEREIRAAVDQLRPDHRQVFLLYHEEGLDYEQMAELLERPIGTLKTWLHRARQQVLGQLRQKGLVPEEISDPSTTRRLPG